MRVPAALGVRRLAAAVMARAGLEPAIQRQRDRVRILQTPPSPRAGRTAAMPSSAAGLGRSHGPTRHPLLMRKTSDFVPLRTAQAFLRVLWDL